MSKIGEYNLLGLLGSGSTAQVFRARHVHTNLEVAMKVVPRSQAIDPSREIRVMKTIRHPHIVSILQVYESERRLYLILELVEGGQELADLLGEKVMSEDKARHYFRQILSAVEYLHSRNMAHRDIKPENILIDSKGNVKLADFGYATAFQAGEMLNTSCGTPTHACPELFAGIQYLGPGVDIWALGIVLVRLLTGIGPFDGSSIKEVTAKVNACSYTLPDTLSPEVRHLVDLMIQKDPKKRVSAQKLMAHPWLTPAGWAPLRPFVNMRSMNIIPSQCETDAIVERMKKLGFTAQETKEAMQNPKFDVVSATVTLLQEQSVVLDREVQDPMEAMSESLNDANLDIAPDLYMSPTERVVSPPSSSPSTPRASISVSVRRVSMGSPPPSRMLTLPNGATSSTASARKALQQQEKKNSASPTATRVQEIGQQEGRRGRARSMSQPAAVSEALKKKMEKNEKAAEKAAEKQKKRDSAATSPPTPVTPTTPTHSKSVFSTLRRKLGGRLRSNTVSSPAFDPCTVAPSSSLSATTVPSPTRSPSLGRKIGLKSASHTPRCGTPDSGKGRSTPEIEEHLPTVVTFAE